MVRFDPARPDFSPYGFSCIRWTPTMMPRCDRHNEIELNLLDKGRLVYLMLVTTDDLILNIALKSGCVSLSRFNEAFRQSFGKLTTLSIARCKPLGVISWPHGMARKSCS